MLGVALAWTAGCSKNESVTPTADDANKAAEAAKTEAAKAADAAKAEAAKVADAARAEAAKAADKAKAQEVIDKAKSLVGENKYQDALNTLQGLAGMKLTDEQQKLVDSLKKQIQDALAEKTASEAKSAAGDLLGGKK